MRQRREYALTKAKLFCKNKPGDDIRCDTSRGGVI